jgi:basic membrane protein A
MRARPVRVIFATLAIFSLLLSACAQPAAQPTPTTAPKPTAAPAAPTPTAAAKPTAVPAAATPTAAAAARPFRVGLVTDVGKVDDKSFNQSAWEGVQQAAKELNAQVKFIETTDAKDYAKNIDQFAQEGYDVIVTVGFAIGQATVEAARKYPNIKFIGVDQFQEKELPNLAGLIFDEDRAGFLAGALAGMMTKTGIVGQVLGTPVVPPVEKFGVGYIAGAKAAKSDVKVLSACHPGGLARGFTDPEWGKDTTNQMIAQNADIIFAAGGNTGNGGLLAIAEAAKAGKNVLGIGVDTDQYFTLTQAQPILLSSSMKLITPGVFNIIKDAQQGRFKGGNVVGQVGLAPFHDLEPKVPADVKEKVKEMQEKGTLGGKKIETGWKAPTGNCPASA